MLNNKHRHGLRHLSARRKWPSHTTGFIILPGAYIRGGWGPGPIEWHPWEILAFRPDRESTAIIRSTADRRVVKTITTSLLETMEETADRNPDAAIYWQKHLARIHRKSGCRPQRARPPMLSALAA